MTERYKTDLEDSDPSESDVVERYSAVERIVIARSTVRVVDVPVDTRVVGRRIVRGERRAAVTLQLQAVQYERRQVGTLGHAF